MTRKQPEPRCAQCSQPTRCQALDQNGRQCRRRAVRVMDYHGSGDLYGFCTDGPEPSWVRVALCDKHSKEETR